MTSDFGASATGGYGGGAFGAAATGAGFGGGAFGRRLKVDKYSITFKDDLRAINNVLLLISEGQSVVVFFRAPRHSFSCFHFLDRSQVMRRA